MTPSRRLAELARFGAVGLFSTAVYFAAYTAGILAGMPFTLASLSAFLVSAVPGYLLHHGFTFRTRAPSTRGLGLWLGIQAVIVALNIAALAALVEALPDRILAQGILLPVIPLISYLVTRRHVFQPV